MNTVFIKNMVCPRCIESVRGIFGTLNIKIRDIKLGEVTTPDDIDNTKKEMLANKLKEHGFELIEDNKSKLIGAIKATVIEMIHYSDEPLYINFSTLLSEKLHYDYSYLSRLFSSVEGVTIEKFIVAQKVEKVKELIFYDEMTLSEIAYRMNYSSVAHLSSQFKKETGMTPSEYKKQRLPGRRPIDSI